MSSYLYCGLIVVSTISIPELRVSDIDKPRLTFTMKNSGQQSSDDPWLHHWLSPSGENLLCYRKKDLSHWLRFPELADFQISANVKEISGYPLPEIPEETVRHLLLDQVLPRCLAHHGKIMLHASAVRLEQGLLIIIGDSGAGKSTLAGNFHQAGNLALSDDCLWIKEHEGQIQAVPSYGGLRLWEDSLEALFAAGQVTSPMAHYSSKWRVPLNANDELASGHAIPVLAVIVLTPPGPDALSEVNLRRLPYREAFIAMLKQTFQLNPTDLERMTRHAQALGRIVPKVPAYRLSMPHDYSLLPQVRQKILEAVL